MDHTGTMERTLDFIDGHITDELSVRRLADRAGYSVSHFSRLFTNAAGMTPMAYVTLRRLEYARYALSRGEKVIDAAMTYGFETHAGFSKAFKHCFGYPPSVCCLRLSAGPPQRRTLTTLKLQLLGGNKMQPHILELSPFSVVGFAGRHTLPHVRRTADIPAYWDTIKLNYGPMLTKLHETFPQSKHFEVSLCYDVNLQTAEFTYLLGRGIDRCADLKLIEPDMTRVDIPGGLYAIFSTPIAPPEEYVRAIQETWDGILLHWLPSSEFEYDESRPDFEYYDHRDHGWYFGGRLQMDICIPIRQREEAVRAFGARATSEV